MALKGNLRNFSITQLLNLVNLAQKTGTLVIKGADDTAWVSFLDGKLTYSRMGTNHDNLAAVLHRAKKLSKAQYQLISSRAAGMSDKELGLLLVNADYISQNEVLASLRAEFIDVLNHLFTWVEGIFQFDDGILPPAGKITLKIGLENIIMEGARCLREWEQLQDELPSLDIALKFADRPGANIRNVNLSVEEWGVVSYINPKNSIKQIARTVKMNDLEIRRIVFGLLQAGLVELVRPEGALPIKQKKPSIAVSSTEEQKSLVNRLIKRIRSL
ncbi:MAG: DUF4388 domain-containing protein [Chloroflexota bacterium]